jgi:hypothetical protein
MKVVDYQMDCYMVNVSSFWRPCCVDSKSVFVCYHSLIRLIDIKR